MPPRRALDQPPAYVSRIKGWLEACERLHGDVCAPKRSLERSGTTTPRWVIDTNQQCLVEGSSASRYLALSYTWTETSTGCTSSNTDQQEPLLLDGNTISDFQKPGFFDAEQTLLRIPNVIQHAMCLVVWLGERYLWVDRLCIIQNDPTTLSQVSEMNHLYEGAYLTIVAASPSCMYRRAMGPRPCSCTDVAPRTTNTDPIDLSCLSISSWLPLRQSPCRRCCCSYCTWNNPATWYRTEEGENGEAGDEVARNWGSFRHYADVEDYYGELHFSTWGERGWTYQERILCSRAVCFTQKSVFFECELCIWDGVCLLPGQDNSRANERAEMTARWNRRWPDFGFYIDLICSYNGRKFTYPQDALWGVSGILNALTRSFPGGFVGGLPRLLLDHALLWQPFARGHRRVDATGKCNQNKWWWMRTPTISSLPSWSWCGWACFVDPKSLRSGLAYLGGRKEVERAGSWQTRKLVDWYISDDDGNDGLSSSERIIEDRMFDDWARITATPDAELPAGWLCASSMAGTSQEPEPEAPFFHEQDLATRFRHPVPQVSDFVKKPSLSTSSYLVGSTTTAHFYPAAVLNPVVTAVARVAPKISAFESPVFERGPDEDNLCSVLVLQGADGAFSGLLRLMDTMPISRMGPLELVAISLGSASGADLRESYEWIAFDADQPFPEVYCVEFLRSLISKNAEIALSTNLAAAFGIDIDIGLDRLSMSRKVELNETVDSEDSYVRFHASDRPGVEEDVMRPWSLSLEHDMQENEVYPYNEPDPYSPENLAICEFYNVLWVERRGKICYRRACGWVPKHVWEANATGPCEVKLG